MRLLALSALLLPLTVLPRTATADTYMDHFQARAELVSLSGVKEVPLYDTVASDSALSGPLVVVALGEDRKAVFLLDFQSDDILLSEDLAKELKLKVHSKNRKLINLMGKEHRYKNDDEVKLTRVASLKLGELELVDVTVRVVAADQLKAGDGSSFDGVIGLAALPEQLSWSILPSQGLVRFGPASAGADLVAALGGTPLDYRHVESEKVKGKVRHYKAETIREPSYFVTSLTVGSASADVALGIGSNACQIDPALAPANALVRPRADYQQAWLEAKLGSLTLPGTWYSMRSASIVLPADPVSGALCLDVLYGYDIAIDPVNHKLALRAPAEVKVVDVSDITVENAQKALLPKPDAESDKKKKEEPKPGEGATDPKKDTAPMRALAKRQEQAGQLDAAIDTWKQVTAIDTRDCAAWLALGDDQLRADKATDAFSALEKAASFYHGWWDLERETREDIVKANKKLKPAELEKAEHIEQAPTCNAADASLAAAHVATGDLDGAIALFRDRMDLDPKLALIAGNAAIAKGDKDVAREAYRQALTREVVGKPLSAARVGLAIVDAQDSAISTPLLGRALQDSPYNSGVLRTWVDQGATAAQIAGWARQQPDSLAAQLAWANAATEPAEREAAMKAATGLASRQALAVDNGPNQRLGRVELALLRGDQEAAEKTLAVALKSRPSDPLVWLAAADVAEAGGDEAKANELRAKAARLGAADPTLAKYLPTKQ